jgi:hypothetical protein
MLRLLWHSKASEHICGLLISMHFFRTTTGVYATKVIQASVSRLRDKANWRQQKHTTSVLIQHCRFIWDVEKKAK